MRRTLTACFLLILGPACAKPEAPVLPSSPPPPPIDVPITFHRGVPLVQGELGPIPVNLVVDTGVNGVGIIPAVAALTGGELRDESVGYDARGSATVHRVFGVELRVAGRALTPLNALPSDGIASLRLAGTMSPAMWADDRVQIDLVRGRLRVRGPATTATPSFRARPVICPRSATPLYVASAVVGGAQVDLAVDTGATYTSVRSDVVPAQPGNATVDIIAASGKLSLQTGPTVEIRIGSHARTKAVAIEPDNGDECLHTRGTLGLDLLIGCVLEIDHDGLRGYCGHDPPNLPAYAPPENGVVVERLDILPECGVDPAELERLAHPSTPWRFHDWLELLGTAAEREEFEDHTLTASIRAVATACHTAGHDIEFALSWTRSARGLIWHVRRKANSP